MTISISFIRILALIISIIFFTAYAVAMSDQSLTLETISTGVLGGAAFTGLLIGCEILLQRFTIRSFNIATLGIIFGYLMGAALLLVATNIADWSKLSLSTQTADLLKMCLFLFTCYAGMALTVRAGEDLYISIPFVKFDPAAHYKKDLLIDSSVLMDPRIIDLTSSGLLDHQIIIPRFSLKEFYTAAESGDDLSRMKARRCLEVIKRLENSPSLGLRYAEGDFPEIKDCTAKLLKLARSLDANILTADISRIQQSSIEGIRIINIHALSNALKPISHAGECINIKIQRYGKEPRQGVGYLDDGTMVVVNGGAEFLGEMIKAQVLSVKHTSSGRMIFCNATSEDLLSEQESAQSLAGLDHPSYFSSMNLSQ